MILKRLIVLSLLSLSTLTSVAYASSDTIKQEQKSDATIEVALLLDTSNSMDGLIEQAKSRLWDIVNTLTTLKYQGKEPQIKIALYEYGNDNLDYSKNYIKQLTPLTQDLDLISEKLFALRTRGGEEYCGAVIESAVEELKWSKNRNQTMKLIYIAGNEPFNQGKIDYKKAIGKANEKGIFVNTIFCGSNKDGIETFWKSGAIIGNGKYFNINSNKEIEVIATPYDKEISKYNSKLNSTYVGYGSMGRSKAMVQMEQDSNAMSKGSSTFTKRIISKTKDNAYKNESWDLVDKVKSDKKYLEKVDEDALPTELQGKSIVEKEQYIEQKNQERVVIKKEIEELSIKREKYIKEQTPKSSSQNGDDLGSAIQTSIYEIAETKGFKH